MSACRNAVFPEQRCSVIPCGHTVPVTNPKNDGRCRCCKASAKQASPERARSSWSDAK